MGHTRRQSTVFQHGLEDTRVASEDGKQKRVTIDCSCMELHQWTLVLKINLHHHRKIISSSQWNVAKRSKPPIIRIGKQIIGYRTKYMGNEKVPLAIPVRTRNISLASSNHVQDLLKSQSRSWAEGLLKKKSVPVSRLSCNRNSVRDIMS